MSKKENDEEGAQVISLSALLSEEIGQEPAEKFTLKEEEEDLLGLEGSSQKTEAEEAAEVERLAKEKEGKSEEELASEAEAKRLAEEAAEVERLAKEKEGKSEEELASEAEAKRLAEEAAEVEETDESIAFKESLETIFNGEITSIIEADEEGNDIETAISDIVMTKELYQDIIANQLSAVKDKAKEGTVSLEGVTEFTRELIEIDRSGGDVSVLLKSKETYIDVLDRMDLGNVEDQKRVVALRYQAEGTKSPEEIEILVKGYEDSGKLEAKAEVSEKEIRGAVAGQMETVKKQALEEKAARKDRDKAYKKTLRENLNEFELEDAIKNKIATLATKVGDKGQYEIDDLFYSMKNDSKMAHKLFLFLLDNKEYNKQVSKKVKKNTQLNTAGKLRIIKKGSAGGGTNLKAGSNGTKDKLVPLSTLSGKIED